MKAVKEAEPVVEKGKSHCMGYKLKFTENEIKRVLVTVIVFSRVADAERWLFDPPESHSQSCGD